MSRLTVAMPKARDGRDRAPTIPASVLAKRAAAAAGGGGAGGAMDVEGAEGTGAGVQPTRKTEKDLMWENGGPGVYSCDYRKYYDLKARRGRGGGGCRQFPCLFVFLSLSALVVGAWFLCCFVSFYVLKSRRVLFVRLRILWLMKMEICWCCGACCRVRMRIVVSMCPSFSGAGVAWGVITDWQ